MSGSAPLGGSSAYNAYTAGFGAGTVPQRPAAAAAAAAAGSSKAKAKTAAVQDDDDELADDVAEYDNFANVSTRDLETLGLVGHPSPACEAASLSSVPSPDCDYALKVPSHVLKCETHGLVCLLIHCLNLYKRRHMGLGAYGAWQQQLWVWASNTLAYVRRPDRCSTASAIAAGGMVLGSK